MKIIITGSSGFIGSYLVKSLIGNNLVTGIDLLPPKTKTGFSFIQHDLSQVSWNFSGINSADTLVHLSQSSNYRNFPEKVKEIFDVNLMGTLNMLEWSRKNGIKRFILASSGNVYKPINGLLTETDLCEPIDFYGTTKYCAEQICKGYSSYFEIIILRIFTVYGPGQQNMMIPRLIDTVKNKNKIFLAKGIGLIINPIYITDFIRILNHVINLQNINSPMVINVCGNESLSYSEMAEIISHKFNILLNLEHKEDLPLILTGNNKKVKEITGINTFVRFEDGITEMINAM